VGVVVPLIALALPFRRLHPSRADVRALPADEEPRQVADLLQRDFPATPLFPTLVLVAMDGDLVDGDRLGELYDFTERLQRVAGVARVESVLSFAGVRDRDHAEALAPVLAHYASLPVPRGQPGLGSVLNGRYALVRVISREQPDSPLAQQQIAAMRQIAAPAGGRALVFGQAAALHDFASGLRARVPWMLAAVMTAMLVVLYGAFRSAILPVKAIVMTVLSLTASFGTVVFVFQDGRLQRLLGYTVVGTTDATLPVVLFAVVFGLSMDYEVLILTRIREAYVRLGRNDDAIVEGLAQTARLVTGAALIMVVVFSAFAVAPVVYVKGLGLGMALAVALDATVVRLLLLPATMALLGRLNWWTPNWTTRK
jgi:RND superfamily putative drug exporter